MKRRQTARVIAGSAIIVGIMLILVAATSLTSILNAIRGTYEIHAVFDHAIGLRVGAPVWIAGREAGQVTAIGFRGVGRDSLPAIVVTMRLPDNVRAHVRRDSRVRLASARLIGDPAVDITPGSATAPVLAAGDTLHATPEATQTAFMHHAAAFSRAIDSLMRSVRHLDVTLDRSSRRWQKLDTYLEATSTELATLQRTIAAGRAFAPDSILAGIRGLGETMQQLQNVLEQAKRREENGGLEAALERARERAAEVARQANELAGLMKRGLPGRMQTDTAIQKALHRTREELDSLISETKRNPLRFWMGNQRKDPGY